MNWRWKATKMTTAGMTRTTAPARIEPNGFAARAATVVDVVGQRHGERLQVVLLGDQERPQELVPGPDEGDDHRGDDGRPRQRDGDPAQDRELRGAVDAGRLEQLAGQLHEELAEDEDRRGVDRERQDHPEVAVRRGRSVRTMST